MAYGVAKTVTIKKKKRKKEIQSKRFLVKGSQYFQILTFSSILYVLMESRKI